MARPDKAAAVAELAENFRESNGAVLTEYRGLSVKQLQQLRRSLGDTVSYAVAKNTLTKLAATEAGLDLTESLLTGPTAIAFIKGDPVEAAKALRNFARDNQALVIKGGFLDGKSMEADEIQKLADLESREVLLAKLAGAMKGGLYKAAATVNAPLAQAARLFGALEAKLAEEGPAAEPTATADQAAEDSAETEAAPEAASDDAGTEG